MRHRISGWALALALVALTILAPGPCALAQSTQVAPQASPLTPGTNASSTVASGNDFQSVFAQANTSTVRLRQGCTIVNTSNTVLYVFMGAIASATTPKSIPLNAASADGSAGGTFRCEDFGPAGAVQTQISVTGSTAGETFFAVQY